MKIRYIISMLLITQSFAMAQPWNPNVGDDSYKNPIIFADYSDPDVIRVGDDFYMTASSFNCFPALPILHSNDLVNWELINYAYLAIRASENGLTLVQNRCFEADAGANELTVEQIPLTESSLFLKLTVKSGGLCSFNYGTNGTEYHTIGEPFQARAGKWIGAKIGIFALAPNSTDYAGYTDYDFFRFE